MIGHLLKFLGTMGSTEEKKNVLAKYDAIISEINNVTIPLVKLMKDNDSVIKLSNKDNYVLHSYYPNGTVEFKTWLDTNLETLENIVKYSEDFKKQLDKAFPVNGITKKTLTIKQTVLLKVISDYYYMSVFVPDFSILVLDNVGNDRYLSKDGTYPIKRAKEILSNVPSMRETLTFYENNVKKLVDEVDEVSSIVINLNVENENFMIEAMGKSKTFDFSIANGFRGNPIGMFRLFLADVKYEMYKANKEKKQLVEVKLLQIEEMAEGLGDVKTEKAVDYYTKRLLKLENKIRRYEESVEL